jgi:hypothetical protein
MVPLPPDAIRARKRPLAIVYVYLAELMWALVIATPVHAWARRAWGAHPDGDAVLWLPGGRDLVVWLGQPDAALAVVTRTALVLLMLGMIAMQLPLGALIASLAFVRGGEPGAPDTGRSLRGQSALRVAVGAFMPLAGLLVLGSVAAIVVLAVGGAASSAVDHGFADRLGDARSFTLRLVTFALFVAVAALVGVVVDLARAAVARDVGLAEEKGTTAPGWTTMLRGLRTAFAVARRELRPASIAWAWRAALSLALIGIGIAAAQALGGRGGAALFGLWVVHQAIVLVRVALRASWLARAVALVAPVQDARSGEGPQAAGLTPRAETESQSESPAAT